MFLGLQGAIRVSDARVASKAWLDAFLGIR